jgi:hypothetical protein
MGCGNQSDLISFGFGLSFFSVVTVFSCQITLLIPAMFFSTWMSWVDIFFNLLAC